MTDARQRDAAKARESGWLSVQVDWVDGELDYVGVAPGKRFAERIPHFDMPEVQNDR